VDIFIYGLTPGMASIRIETLISDLSSSYLAYLTDKAEEQSEHKTTKKPKITYEFKCVRNRNCLTFIYDDKYTFQLITRIYQNKSQVLHGFDLGSSAVGFDGENLYFTSLSKFAYEYSCNILDTNRRSTTYEKRLIKYFKRNFDIILPNFDLSKLRNINAQYGLSDVCEMPYMVFSYDSIKGNKINIDNFLRPSSKHDSDYQIADLNEYKIFYINLHNMVWNKNDFYFYTERTDDVLKIKPLVSKRKVTDYYDDFCRKIRVSGNINLKLLKKYLTNTKKIFEVMVEKGDEAEEFVSLLGDEIEDEKRRVLGLVDQLLTQSYPIDWITSNPGTQITSSFNPIIEDVTKWYGPYYVAVAKSSPLVVHSEPIYKKRTHSSVKCQDEEHDYEADEEDEEDEEH
jgi:hypothetical protein